MKIKKIVSALTLAVTLALVGCGNTEETTISGDGANKIIVFQSKVEILDELNELAKDYEKETGVEVEVWSTSGDAYFTENKTKIANGQGPTIFSLLPGQEVEQMANYLADLTDLSFIDDLPKDTVISTSEGKLVGIPYTVEGFGVVYNKNLIDANTIASTEDFNNMMKEQKEAGVNGFGLSQEDYFLVGHILNTPFSVQEDPDAFLEQLANGETTMVGNGAFEEFADIMAAVREYSYNPMQYNYEKEMGDFATGLTASVHQGNWSYGMLDDYSMDFEPAFMPLPIIGNDKLAVSVPSVWVINNQASSEEIKAGKEFIEWLYTSETGKDYLYNKFGFIPLIDGDEADSLDPLSKEVQRFTQEGNTIPWSMQKWPASSVSLYFAPVVQDFFTSEMTADELLAALDNAYAEAVAATR